jgi:hypothetical protein
MFASERRQQPDDQTLWMPPLRWCSSFSLCPLYDLDWPAALAHEFRHGMIALAADAQAGVSRFMAGQGWHGDRVESD